MKSTYTHSVTLNEEKCKGCINCIKRCPTQAIRVRDGKAHIISEKCIDCGECIKVCPYHAKKAVCSQLSEYKGYKHLVALPAPTLYSQFNNIKSVEQILAALLDIGFDSYFEVARAAELVSDATGRIIHSMPKPVLSSACPAIIRLIKVKFPQLINNILPLVSPMELAARLAKMEVSDETGLLPEEIGCIFITPCPAKITDINNPIGSTRSAVDGAVSIKDIYPSMIKALENPHHTAQVTTGKIGIAWASCGGEGYAVQNIDNYLSCDGIEDVIKVLENLEDEKFNNLDFVELNACSAGCVGGVLTVENPYLAKTKLKKVKRDLPNTANSIKKSIPPHMLWNANLEYSPVFEFGGDFKAKFKAYSELEEILKELPGIDCGCCGAPTCRCFAEDVVNGKSNMNDCVVIMKEKMGKIISTIMEI